ncbi:MAG: hypothetical protein ACTSQI_07130 [Candidatus Helarchaeota archaeon]
MSGKEKLKRPKDMNHLIEIFEAFQEFHLITAGIEPGVFDFLGKRSLTAEEIADSLVFEMLRAE